MPFYYHLGADVKDERIAISGWTETSDQEVIPFIQIYQEEGVRYVICTDISKDGMLEGPAFELYKKFDVDKMCQTTFTEYKKLIKLS